MPNPVRLLATIRDFDDWSHPWRFAESVRSSLDCDDAKLFADVWDEACNSKHWLGASKLSLGVDIVGRTLAVRFPWLTSEALTAITSAAAYQWR